MLTARELIDNDEPLLIFNADTYCPTKLAQSLATMGSPVRRRAGRVSRRGRQMELCPRGRAGPRARNGREAAHFRRGPRPGCITSAAAAISSATPTR